MDLEIWKVVNMNGFHSLTEHRAEADHPAEYLPTDRLCYVFKKYYSSHPCFHVIMMMVPTKPGWLSSPTSFRGQIQLLVSLEVSSSQAVMHTILHYRLCLWGLVNWVLFLIKCAPRSWWEYIPMFSVNIRAVSMERQSISTWPPWIRYQLACKSREPSNLSWNPVWELSFMPIRTSSKAHWAECFPTIRWSKAVREGSLHSNMRIFVTPMLNQIV